MIRVLYDVNVVLDVLAAREPFVEDSARALSLAEIGTVRGLLAAHTVTTLHYLLERELGGAGTRRVLSALMGLCEVVAVDGAVLRHALGLKWRDFEDAVQAVCAESVGADVLVSRDKRGFAKAATRVLTPGELVALVET